MELEKQLGPEGKLKLEGKDGKLKISVDYDGHQMDAGAYVAVSSDELVDKLAELIPGDSAIEQGALALLKAALRSALA
jgi:hypothetical protein